MAEEIRVTDYDDAIRDVDDVRVLEWEVGLPNIDDLLPLSQSLISSELLSAFSITPEPYRNMSDVNRASQSTFSDLHGELVQQQSFVKSIIDNNSDNNMEVEPDLNNGGDGGVEEEVELDEVVGRAAKRARLVWTPQLHKRFVEVVARLGVKTAVPKTIMQMMNVEGLSRENVASHLQKYRLYLKRMHGLNAGGGSSSSNAHFNESGSGGGGGYRHGLGAGAGAMYPQLQMVPMPYPSPQMVPNNGGGESGGGYHNGYETNSYPYNMAMQQRDWSGNQFGLVSAYQHRMTPNNK